MIWCFLRARSGAGDDESFSAVRAARTGADVQNSGVPGYPSLQCTARYNEVVDILRDGEVLSTEHQPMPLRPALLSFFCC